MTAILGLDLLGRGCGPRIFSGDTPLLLQRLSRRRLYGRLVGLTGLIYAAIVVAWAIFLYRLALQRHDRAAHHHSMRRFSSAMRILSHGGRPSAVYRESDEEAVHAEGSLVPHSSTEALAHGHAGASPAPAVDTSSGSAIGERVRDDLPARPLSNGSTVVAVDRRPSRYAERVAAVRRRRVLLVLLAATVVTVVGAAFGVVAWWGTAIPLALVMLFLWVARRQVRLADERFWAEAARARPESSNVVRRSTVRVDASHGSSRDPADDEPTVILPVAAVELQDERVAAVPLTTAGGGSLWDPVAMTLPTYVEKGVAKRTIRTVDLGGADTWSAGHSAAASKSAADAEQEVARRAEVETDALRAANA